MSEFLLEVKDLRTYFDTPEGDLKAVDGVSFSIRQGETLGIVGESGSGKSVSSMTILRLMKKDAYIHSGEILFEGKDLTKISEKEMNEIRGNRISVIFQEPMTSLNPVFTVGKQLREVFMLHQGMDKKEAEKAACEALRETKVPDPERVMKEYPHQLSGGMRQRVMIAMALSCKPKLLIADEPTTALDVTIQAQILRLMNDLKKDLGTSIIFITHDLGVMSQMADQIVVMYCGRVMEKVKASTLFDSTAKASHPYTEALLHSIPRMETRRDQRLESIPGAVPDPMELPEGCKFAPRCKYATEKCHKEEPFMQMISEDQEIRCHYPTKEERHV